MYPCREAPARARPQAGPGLMRWRPRRGDLRAFDNLGPHRRRPHLPILVSLAILRWRRELAIAVGLIWGLQALAAATHPVAAAAISLVGLVGMFGWRPGRLFVAERALAIMIEHRLRVGMLEAGILSWSGRLPASIATKPVTRGVRVLVWCPAGVDVTSFLANRELLAAACWASGVEVTRHPRRAQLVSVLVVTHPEERAGR